MKMNDDKLWKKVKRDKMFYGAILLITIGLWGGALYSLGTIGFLYESKLDYLYKSYDVGMAKMVDIEAVKQKLFGVVFAFTIILAILLTVVLMMRQRTAALTEIQIRLALLEQHIDSQQKLQD